MDKGLNSNTDSISAIALMINAQGMLLSAGRNSYFFLKNRISWMRDTSVNGELNIRMRRKSASC